MIAWRGRGSWRSLGSSFSSSSSRSRVSRRGSSPIPPLLRCPPCRPPPARSNPRHPSPLMPHHRVPWRPRWSRRRAPNSPPGGVPPIFQLRGGLRTNPAHRRAWPPPINRWNPAPAVRRAGVVEIRRQASVTGARVARRPIPYRFIRQTQPRWSVAGSHDRQPGDGGLRRRIQSGPSRPSGSPVRSALRPSREPAGSAVRMTSAWGERAARLRAVSSTTMVAGLDLELRVQRWMCETAYDLGHFELTAVAQGNASPSIGPHHDVQADRSGQANNGQANNGPGCTQSGQMAYSVGALPST